MPNDVNTTSYTATFIDRDGERSTTGVQNTVAADNPTYVGLRDDFEAQLDVLSNGTRWRRQEALVTRLTSQAPPTNNSFRENKWLVRFEDNVNFERGSFTVPTADPSGVTLIAGTDNIDLSVAPGPDIKSAIEAFVVSVLGNPITVYEITYVGRNI